MSQCLPGSRGLLAEGQHPDPEGQQDGGREGSRLSCVLCRASGAEAGGWQALEVIPVASPGEGGADGGPQAEEGVC